MSALSHRDANAQPTSHPIGNEKQGVDGVENKDLMGEKQRLEKKYTFSDA